MTSQNPYSPPKAHVEDVPQNGDDKGSVQARPPEVDRAFWLIIASAALGIVSLLLQGMQNLVVSAFVLALFVGFSFAIRRGQNWARIAFAVLYVLGLPTLFLAPTFIAQFGVAFFLIFCIQTMLQGAGIWFVFRKPGALWFRKAKARAA